MSTNYRNYIGTERHYDVGAMLQFNLATLLGLREHHKFLDIGCGSLRLGRLLIPYLLPENYYGIEPNFWQVKEGIDNEVSNQLIEIKKANITEDRFFNLSTWDTKFDFVWAFGIFTHATQDQINKCFDEFVKCSHENTMMVANFVEGDSDSGQDEWSYPGFAKYRFDFFKNLAEDRGLNCVMIDYP